MQHVDQPENRLRLRKGNVSQDQQGADSVWNSWLPRQVSTMHKTVCRRLYMYEDCICTHVGYSKVKVTHRYESAPMCAWVFGSGEQDMSALFWHSELFIEYLYEHRLYESTCTLKGHTI